MNAATAEIRAAQNEDARKIQYSLATCSKSADSRTRGGRKRKHAK
jgi:hypothetical protein